MDINELRKDIDQIDEGIVELLKRRMDTSARIAEYKKENGLKIYDPHRERELLLKVSEMAGEDYESSARVLFSLLMELSRSYQNKLILPRSRYEKIIASALQDTEKLFPERASVACKGSDDGLSQLACEKLFSLPNMVCCNSFDAVFAAVDQGLCRYGVLPLENSTAGSVNHIYDLMAKNGFYIVRSTRVRANYPLAKQGTENFADRETDSLEQAINFICISKKPEIYPGADRTSMILVLPHRPGSLYRVISRFYAHNINLTKLESRPIDGRDFEFMFYFDVNASVYSPALTQLVCELENDIDGFFYLGSYSEIV